MLVQLTNHGFSTPPLHEYPKTKREESDKVNQTKETEEIETG
jgi:hypothetical protein